MSIQYLDRYGIDTRFQFRRSLTVLSRYTRAYGNHQDLREARRGGGRSARLRTGRGRRTARHQPGLSAETSPSRTPGTPAQGLYRLPAIPPTAEDEYHEAVLQARGEGVIAGDAGSCFGTSPTSTRAGSTSRSPLANVFAASTTAGTGSVGASSLRTRSTYTTESACVTPKEAIAEAIDGGIAGGLAEQAIRTALGRELINELAAARLRVRLADRNAKAHDEQGTPRLPGDRVHLSKLLDKWASSSEDRVTAGRLRRIVGMTVIAQMLDGLRDEKGRERFAFKGGAALELRFGHRARDSNDVDGAYRGDVEECRQLVAEAVGRGVERIHRHGLDGELITNTGLARPPLRFRVKLFYKGKEFMTLPFEVSEAEGRSLESVERLRPAVSLRPVQLPDTEEIPFLPIAYQIAKSCTLVPRTSATSERTTAPETLSICC